MKLLWCVLLIATVGISLNAMESKKNNPSYTFVPAKIVDSSKLTVPNNSPASSAESTPVASPSFPKNNRVMGLKKKD